MDDPSTPARRWRKIEPTSGLSMLLPLNIFTVSERNPARSARSSQLIMRLLNGSVARALEPPADCEPPNPLLVESLEPEPASEASASTAEFGWPHWNLKRPLLSV